MTEELVLQLVDEVFAFAESKVTNPLMRIGLKEVNKVLDSLMPDFFLWLKGKGLLS